MDPASEPQDPGGVKALGELPPALKPGDQAVLQTEPVCVPTRYIAGFWRRLFAFVIDAILISIPGFVLGYLFYGFFSSGSDWNPVIGFAFTILYFAVLGSSVGKGQTLGQRWTGIETVDAQGNHFSFGKSFLRYTVLLVPIFFGGILPTFLSWLTSFALLAVVYLYLFNVRTRQTLHDLATGSYVVETLGTGAVKRSPVWPWHWAVLGALAFIGLVAPSLLNRTGTFSELFAVEKALEQSDQFRDVKVALQTNRTHNTTDLRVTVICRYKPTDYERTAARIVGMVEQADPEAARQDFISVVFKEGFQVGFATFSNSRYVSHTPQQWEDILQNTP
jgi:uncharacterized RDD family membrane protein YckC